jgi:hypothetical protein
MFSDIIKVHGSRRIEESGVILQFCLVSITRKKDMSAEESRPGPSAHHLICYLCGAPPRIPCTFCHHHHACLVCLVKNILGELQICNDDKENNDARVASRYEVPKINIGCLVCAHTHTQTHTDVSTSADAHAHADDIHFQGT